MIGVIGQCVEGDNQDGARQLFDVLETLLILVSKTSLFYTYIVLMRELGNSASRRPYSGARPVLNHLRRESESRRRPPNSRAQCAQLDYPIVSTRGSPHFSSTKINVYGSKKSKIHSLGLGPAILAGLMSIATEDEPVDADDDAPARVRSDLIISKSLHLIFSTVRTPNYRQSRDEPPSQSSLSRASHPHPAILLVRRSFPPESCATCSWRLCRGMQRVYDAAYESSLAHDRSGLDRSGPQCP